MNNENNQEPINNPFETMNKDKKETEIIDEPQVINNPFANMNREKNQIEVAKKKNKIIIIITTIIISILLLYIFIDKIGDSINKNAVEPQAKEDLNEVALDLQAFIIDNKLDALDAYGKNDLLRVAINEICSGVYECKKVDAKEAEDYIKKVFNKETELKDVDCELSDGVLYIYDSNSNSFIWNENHPKHDGLNTEPVYTKLNSIKKKNGKYIMVLNKLYFSQGKSEFITTDPFGINRIYSFSDYDMPSENGPVLDMTKVSSDYENEFSKLKNKGTKYEYTFIKEGKKYYLEKYNILESE